MLISVTVISYIVGRFFDSDAGLWYVCNFKMMSLLYVIAMLRAVCAVCAPQREFFNVYLASGIVVEVPFTSYNLFDARQHDEIVRRLDLGSECKSNPCLALSALPGVEAGSRKKLSNFTLTVKFGSFFPAGECAFSAVIFSKSKQVALNRVQEPGPLGCPGPLRDVAEEFRNDEDVVLTALRACKRFAADSGFPF